jgi:uncharacterized protein (DUF58 family)
MKFIRSLYFNRRFFICLFTLVGIFIAGYIWQLLFAFAKITTVAFFVLSATDILMLYIGKRTIFARRDIPEKLSNGDENEIRIYIENHYRFAINVNLIDEIPFQFQVRDFNFTAAISTHGNKIIRYSLRPVKRGEYFFGNLNVYVRGPIKMVSRRFKFDNEKTVPVYPSFLQMRKYELLAISNNLKDEGIKRLRKLGHSMEFENIREYVTGDDPRAINWKSTARKAQLMVNHFQDEKSQQVYSLIDEGRTMLMPFDGLSLLDYSINASLVISNIALRKQDKAGLITFSNKISSVLPADKKLSQLKTILEVLYNQKTNYLESNYEMVYAKVRHTIHQRALLILFSNFGSLNALYRQMPYLRKIAKNHLLIVVFFENTELAGLLYKRPINVEQIYIKTIAEQFVYEKKQMVKELESIGIHAILTSPANLTGSVINKYLEMKSRRLI